MDTKNQKAQATPRSQWVRPELQRLHAGAAESQRGASADGGGVNQGS